ncbi:hypothetical protein BCV69DRAFT_285477 [Microstroma glucosiphilum]|uniref:Uncharacterized protein n=1 Tax=Pseudomicrostroma glucosiphilum TaxID=1684307 RepID=A0A316TYE7_9BASI|nr:hypothetical protein BCV69DRAFT_285477 [Pseudomicrostroma glucosiphilum]PWN18177.1 hypothetical protein BCV69DRAFT_285477 [Pseudomicrostroma glucosiphilum]
MSALFPSVRSALRSSTGVSRSFSASAVSRYASAPGPTAKSRTSPGKTPVKGEGERQHPGYISENVDPTSDHPAELGEAPAGSQPHSQVRKASTKTGPAHPDVEAMAKGAESDVGGSDAITPTERTQKVWGPNSRTPEFNEYEGKRNPVLDGGSHEGGLREDGKGSKT